MSKVGDIYINKADGVLVSIEHISIVKSYGSNKGCTYFRLEKVSPKEWYGSWEKDWFLLHFRPLTKLDKLLAGYDR